MKKKYLKPKVREFKGDINTNFLDNDLLKENTYYTCIACITSDSIIGINKKKLFTSLFRRVQVQNKGNTYAKIHKH